MTVADSAPSDRGRLLRALTLSRQFHFYIVTCPTPRSADNLVEWLAQELPRARQEPVEIRRLDPHKGRRRADGLAREEITKHVLEPLLSSTNVWRHGQLAIVDASRAEEQDDDAWRWCFSRWNEQRNAVQARLAAELVLLLSTRLTTLFARAAPDVWSTRSGEYVLEDDVAAFVAPTPASVGVEREAAGVVAPLWPPTETELTVLNEQSASELNEGLIAARQLGEAAMQTGDFPRAEQHFTRAHLCARALARTASPRAGGALLLPQLNTLELLARAIVERGRLERASAVLQAASIRIAEAKIGGGRWVPLLRAALDIARLAADVALARGDLAGATAYNELELKLVASDVMLTEQACSLQRRAAIATRRGEFGAAEGHLRSAEEALGRTQNLMDPGLLRELQADIAQTWSDVLAHKDVINARIALSQALSLRGGFVRRYGGLLRLGRLDMHRGESDRAAVAFADGLDAALGSEHYLDWLEALRLTEGLDLTMLGPGLPVLRQELLDRCAKRRDTGENDAAS